MSDMPALPTIHVISDSMGNTAKTVARSAASHFGELDPNITVLPYVSSFEQIRSFLEDEQRTHRQMYGDDRIIVFYTLVIQELRDALESYLVDHPNIHAVDVLSDPILAIEQVSGKVHNPTPGEQHKINDQYFQRIEAIEFTVSHDDGLLTQDLAEADIVILGVSRTSKTPDVHLSGTAGLQGRERPPHRGNRPSQGDIRRRPREALRAHNRSLRVGRGAKDAHGRSAGAVSVRGHRCRDDGA